MQTKTWTREIPAIAASMFFLLTAMPGCQKVDLEEDLGEQTETEDGAFTVRFNIGNVTQTGFEDFPENPLSAQAATRATPVSDLCSRINLIIYQDGTKVKQVNSESTDSDFGQLSVSLNPGKYEYVILAHNCDGNVTATDINKISFPNNKVTDTFHTYGTLTVDGSSTQDITMDRVAAMVRFITNDDIPDNVEEMKFFYTGGSSTIDGTTGYGCVNSRQTEIRTVTSDMRPDKGVFEIYTIPHTDEEDLKITVTALDSEEETVKEESIEDVPVKRNQITNLSGNFFGGTSTGNNGNLGFDLVTDDEWTEEDYVF